MRQVSPKFALCLIKKIKKEKEKKD